MSAFFACAAFEHATASGPPPTGTVSGQVNVSSGYRLPRMLPVFKNRSFCGATVPDETLLIGARGELQNAAVTLRPRGVQPNVRPQSLVLDNKRCAFVPHVQIAVVGSELLLTNSDPILHTVHARRGSATLFNVGLPRWRRVVKRLDRAGVIRIDCDVLHTWMSAVIIVTDTPHFAVTDTAGRFTIDHLPAGEYEMKIWHERLGTLSADVTVMAGSTRFVEAIYSSK